MSAGAIIGTGTVLLVIGLMCGVFGYIIDFIGNQSHYFTLSATTLTTMGYISFGMYSFGFLFFLAAIFHHIIVSLNEQTGYA